jgi:hypothetical protein
MKLGRRPKFESQRLQRARLTICKMLALGDRRGEGFWWIEAYLICRRTIVNNPRERNDFLVTIIGHCPVVTLYRAPFDAIR